MVAICGCTTHVEGGGLFPNPPYPFCYPFLFVFFTPSSLWSFYVVCVWRGARRLFSLQKAKPFANGFLFLFVLTFFISLTPFRYEALNRGVNPSNCEILLDSSSSILESATEYPLLLLFVCFALPFFFWFLFLSSLIFRFWSWERGRLKRKKGS